MSRKSWTYFMKVNVNGNMRINSCYGISEVGNPSLTSYESASCTQGIQIPLKTINPYITPVTSNQATNFTNAVSCIYYI